MDANFAFWTAVLINFTVLTSFTISGVRQIRRGEVARHKRSMTIAAFLVGAFLICYGLKLATLGREDLSEWSHSAINTLRIHELCVLTMLLAGGLALYRGLGLRRTRLVTHDEGDPAPEPLHVKTHRMAGRIALGSALLGVLFAGLVLLGMYGRL